MVAKKGFRAAISKVLVYAIITILSASMLIPMLNIIAKSFSDIVSVTSGQVFIIPKNPQLGAYKYVLSESIFYSSFFNSVFVTAVGSLAAMLLTVMTAYPMSRKNMRGRSALMILWIFVMVFNGGMVPNFMLYRTLRLSDTLPVLIIPGMLSVFNMLIVKNYFEGLPPALEEAAKIDGASNMRVLFNIMLPLAMPVMATVALFYAVGYWNDYFTAMLYIADPGKKPLQLYLYESLKKALMEVTSGSDFEELTTGRSLEAVRSASIVVTILPILVVYPFLQKYFVKGIVIGSVKG